MCGRYVAGCSYTACGGGGWGVLWKFEGESVKIRFETLKGYSEFHQMKCTALFNLLCTTAGFSQYSMVGYR